jgi:hypothetical protein
MKERRRRTKNYEEKGKEDDEVK